jgi:hypothetical protein
LRDIILQNLAAIDPRAAEILSCQILEAMGPLVAEWARMMRDIILQKSSNGPARRGILSCKIWQQLTRIMRDIIMQNWAAMGPHDAGYYHAKLGSNGPA